MFLAVQKRKVIDTAFAAAIAEDLAADPPVAAVAEIAEVSHIEVEQVYIEDAAAQVAANIENRTLADYYEIEIDPSTLAASLNAVSIKTGARGSAPAREIVEIEANGRVVGSAVVEA